MAVEPTETGGDWDIDSADKAAAEKIRKKAAEAEARTDTPSSPDDDLEGRAPVVSVEDTPEPDDDDTREGKRHRRVKDILQSENEARAEAAYWKGRAEGANQTAPPKSDEPDAAEREFNASLEELERHEDNLSEEIRRRAREGKIPQSDIDGYRKKGHELTRKKQQLWARREASQQAVMVESRATQAAIRADLESRYSDVYGNDDARAYAASTLQRIVALNKAKNAGKNMNQMIDEAANEARRDILGVRPAPTKREKERLGGVPPSRRSAPDRREATEVEMIAPYRKMAREMYPKLPEKDALERWARGPGKRLLSNQRYG